MENNNQNGNPAEMLSSLLGNEDFLARLTPVLETLKSSGITASPAQAPNGEETPNPPAAELPAPPTLPPELMAKLPDLVATLAPVLHGEQSPKKPNHDKRTALLLALRPYLSQNRCEAIDYITRIGKLGDVIKNLNL